MNNTHNQFDDAQTHATLAQACELPPKGIRLPPDISFCNSCGDYVPPASGEITLDRAGEPIILCDTCLRMQDRILTPAQAGSRSGDILP